MGLLPEKVYEVGMILEGLLLLAVPVWSMKITYENYRKGRSFREGNHKMASVVVCVILFFQFLIPTVYKLFILAFILGMYSLFFILLDRHNKAHHTGEVLLLLDGEIKRMKRRMALVFLLVLVVAFLVYGEWRYWYG